MKSFESIVWNQAFSIGNLHIDKEHARIIEIYNEMAENSKNGLDRRKFAEVLSAMFDYSLHHFRNEEAYMKLINYPDIEGHIAKHKAYILHVSKLNAGFMTSDPPEPKSVLSFLNDWWFNHIQKVDIQYENYKREYYPNLTVNWDSLKWAVTP